MALLRRISLALGRKLPIWAGLTRIFAHCDIAAAMILLLRVDRGGRRAGDGAVPLGQRA